MIEREIAYKIRLKAYFVYKKHVVHVTSRESTNHSARI